MPAFLENPRLYSLYPEWIAGLLEEIGSYRSAVEDYERAILCSPSDELVNDIVLRRQRAQQRIRRLH